MNIRKNMIVIAKHEKVVALVFFYTISRYQNSTFHTKKKSNFNVFNQYRNKFTEFFHYTIGIFPGSKEIKNIFPQSVFFPLFNQVLSSVQRELKNSMNILRYRIN